jgi:alpha-D-xyloside xylohydrolase
MVGEAVRRWTFKHLGTVSGSSSMLSPGEALYGLGQHQEGFLNVRDIPVRLLQANTNIAIPFLISTKGYGLLWNNAALTDFDPATEAIPSGRHRRGNIPDRA